MTRRWGSGPRRDSRFFLTFRPTYVLVLFVTTPRPSPDHQPDESAEARTARHLRGLAELGEIGLELARLVRRKAVEQAEASPDGAVDEHLGLVFARIARAVRQTFALEARLGEESRKAAAAETRRHVERRKTRVRTAVERVLDAEADQSDAENLFYDLTERLETDYEDADFTDRPVGELVARICRDLGVTPDWSLWQDEDWAIEARGTEASPPGEIERTEAAATCHRIADDPGAPWRPPPD
jgi:hypothetical protein